MSDTKKKINKKKMSTKQKVLITVLIVLNLLFIIAAGVFYILKDFNQVEITDDLSELGIDSSTNSKYLDSGIVNIALFGVDTRSNEFRGLSDSIMIASIDKKGGVVKLTSIPRDSEVNIQGHGPSKINAAYSWGGHILAINTLNRNFNMDIKDYITINMRNLTKVIDKVGGVTVEITEKERRSLNSIMRGFSPNSPRVATSGKVHLDGAQATAFCRIRKIDSDFVRIERQKEVLTALFNKAIKLNIAELTSLAQTLMPMVETSLGLDDIIGLASLATVDNLSLKNLKFPNKTVTLKKSTTSNVIYDLYLATEQLHDFIYKDESVYNQKYGIEDDSSV